MNTHKSIVSYQYKARNWRLRRAGLSYQEFLNSEAWKNIKKELSKDETFRKCYICGSPDFIEFHHKTYTKMFAPIDKQKQTIVVLCRMHHSEVHEMSKKNNWGLKQAVRRVRKDFIRKMEKIL